MLFTCRLCTGGSKPLKIIVNMQFFLCLCPSACFHAVSNIQLESTQILFNDLTLPYLLPVIKHSVLTMLCDITINFPLSNHARVGFKHFCMLLVEPKIFIPTRFCHVIYYHSDKKYPCLKEIVLSHVLGFKIFDFDMLSSVKLHGLMVKLGLNNRNLIPPYY